MESKKILLSSLFFLSALYLFGGTDKNNFSSWSVERYGLKMRSYTEKKSFNYPEDVIVRFQIKNVSPELDPILACSTDLIGQLFNRNQVKLTNVGTGEVLSLKKDFIKRFQQGLDNPFCRAGLYPVPEKQKTIFHDDGININELFDLKEGTYSFSCERWVSLRYKLENEWYRPRKMAVLRIPSVVFTYHKKTVSPKSADNTEMEAPKDKKPPFELHEKQQWSNSVFGIKGQAYLTSNIIDKSKKRKGIYICVVLENFSDKTLAIEDAVIYSEGAWNIVIEDSHGEMNKLISSVWFNAFKEQVPQETLYWLQPIQPKEKRYFKILLQRSEDQSFNDEMLWSRKGKLRSDGNYILKMKRRIYYSPDGKYNSATTKGQIGLLGKLQMKELVFPPIKFTIKNSAE
jgi:hypothetical protein